MIRTRFLSDNKDNNLWPSKLVQCYCNPLPKGREDMPYTNDIGQTDRRTDILITIGRPQSGT